MQDKKYILTCLGVIGGMIVLGVISSFLIDLDTNKAQFKKKNLTDVVYVNNRMYGREVFNKLAVQTKSIPKDLVRGNIILSLNNITNSSKDFCIKEDMFIPKDSLLSNDYLIYCEDLEEDLLEKVDSNLYVYELGIDSKTSLIKEDDYITVTLSMTDEQNLQVRKEYIRGIPTLVVKDKSLLVVVNEEVYKYLQMASFMDNIKIEVAKAKNKTDKYVIKDSVIKDYILENFEN